MRAQYKERLDRIPFFELIEKSGQLRNHFLEGLVRPHLKHVYQKAVISFYPFDTEPQINIEEEGGGEPFQVAYVRIDDWNQRKMEARYARRDQPGQWEDIEPVSGVRIFQPAISQTPCIPDQTAMILVPSLAFTENGERLGRGAGFYDRYLKSCPQVLRVGVCVQDQIAPQVPCESWDELMDVVLTDQGIFTTNRFREWQNHGKVLSRATSTHEKN